MPPRAGDTAARDRCHNSVTPPIAVRFNVQQLADV